MDYNWSAHLVHCVFTYMDTDIWWHSSVLPCATLSLYRFHHFSLSLSTSYSHSVYHWLAAVVILSRDRSACNRRVVSTTQPYSSQTFISQHLCLLRLFNQTFVDLYYLCAYIYIVCVPCKKSSKSRPCLTYALLRWIVWLFCTFLLSLCSAELIPFFFFK